MEFKIENNRIYSLDDENIIVAEICFEEKENNLYNINHTFVDKKFRGQGIAQKLVEMAVKEIKNRGGKVQASCSYAKHYLEKNYPNI